MLEIKSNLYGILGSCINVLFDSKIHENQGDMTDTSAETKYTGTDQSLFFGHVDVALPQASFILLSKMTFICAARNGIRF